MAHSKSHWFRRFEWKFVGKAFVLTFVMLGTEYFVLHTMLDVQNSRASLLASAGQALLGGFNRKVNTERIRIARLECATADSIDGIDPCSACGMRRRLTELLPAFLEKYQPSVVALDFFFDSQTYCEAPVNTKFLEMLELACNSHPIVFAYGSVGNTVQKLAFQPAAPCREGYSNPSRDPREVYLHADLEGGQVATFAAQSAAAATGESTAGTLRFAHLLKPGRLKEITYDMDGLLDRPDIERHKHKVWIFGSTRDHLFEIPGSPMDVVLHRGVNQYGHEIHASHVAALADKMTAAPLWGIDFVCGLVLWTLVELARTPLRGGAILLLGLAAVFAINAALFVFAGYYSDFVTLSFAGILIWLGSNALPNLFGMHSGHGHS